MGQRTSVPWMPLASGSSLSALRTSRRSASGWYGCHSSSSQAPAGSQLVHGGEPLLERGQGPVGLALGVGHAGGQRIRVQRAQRVDPDDHLAPGGMEGEDGIGRIGH